MRDERKRSKQPDHRVHAPIIPSVSFIPAAPPSRAWHPAHTIPHTLPRPYVVPLTSRLLPDAGSASVCLRPSSFLPTIPAKIQPYSPPTCDLFPLPLPPCASPPALPRKHLLLPESGSLTPAPRLLPSTQDNCMLPSSFLPPMLAPFPSPPPPSSPSCPLP